MITRSSLHKFLSVILFAALYLLLVGCNKEDLPGQQPGQKPAVAPRNVKPLQKQISSAQTAVAPAPINFSKKKDPFRPFVLPSTVVSKAAATGRTKAIKRSDLPIHSFDVSQFKVSGIVTGLRENRALIVDPNGKAYVIKVGMTVGLNEGRVTRINTASIEITEQFTDESGKKRKQVVKLTLPRKQENMK